ncbi:unnamed protein product [Penicillium salamii]|uniref:Ras-GEF domain-containing protein n=1 Tax=Penicillium salamii TaxID=1612424 RepID=A0A9W4IJ54_9EURO|nr:unnamed protein product [Penicillium salamii]CAG8082197.1 unnamed protein product [Penicillium salamii]CAG8099126.1 unnamed protein product [Penicillium salamii]CAG8107234.1 unnamed protein product [Penicillium salamii]CAG8115338.1 unnamed protein product [Penicillium salamii]
MMALDSGHSPLFQTSLEIPAFFVSYRWWEDEATTVFWAFDIQEISRVIRFGLFRDENFPRTSLRARNTDTIDAFLIALSVPHEYQLLDSLSHMQRVEEILRRSSIPPFEAIPWSWFPQSQASDAREIATAIETESHFHFRQIDFEEFVRAALGYNALFVDWFLQQHTALYLILLNHLQAHPEDVPLYTEVEKHLRSRSPFAHRALLHSLMAVKPGGSRDIPRPNATGFQFIAGPIQDLFKDQPGRLSDMLKMLSVLAVRFRRQYAHAAAMNWKTPFDTSLAFLEDCLTYSSPMDLALNMKGLDEHQFAEITRQALVTDDAAVRQLFVNWQTLNISVWECCCALPDLIPYLQDCVQNLLATRNYHSLMAMISGLRNYAISTMRTDVGNSNALILEALIPPEIISLMNPAENYSAYRQHYKKYPGVPFLIPHIRDFKQNGDTGLEPVCKFLQAE